MHLLHATADICITFGQRLHARFVARGVCAKGTFWLRQKHCEQASVMRN
mgnify:CR=1 FL=1